MSLSHIFRRLSWFSKVCFEFISRRKKKQAHWCVQRNIFEWRAVCMSSKFLAEFRGFLLFLPAFSSSLAGLFTFSALSQSGQNLKGVLEFYSLIKIWWNLLKISNLLCKTLLKNVINEKWSASPGRSSKRPEDLFKSKKDVQITEEKKN